MIDIADEKLIPVARAVARAEIDTTEEYVGDLPPSLDEAITESWCNHGISLHGFGVHDAYGEEKECFYPSGGLCILEREAIAPLLPELFPQQYFAYHEDVYLGMRLRVRGGFVAKEPRAVAVHLAGSTAKRLGRPRLRYLMERNRCLNRLGYYPGGVIWRLLPLFALQEFLYGLYLLIRRPLDFAGLVAARIWLATHWSEVLRWRGRCRSEVTVPDSEWLGELSGKVRGDQGLLNRLALSWCRRMRIPHREGRNNQST